MLRPGRTFDWLYDEVAALRSCLCLREGGFDIRRALTPMLRPAGALSGAESAVACRFEGRTLQKHELAGDVGLERNCTLEVISTPFPAAAGRDLRVVATPAACRSCIACRSLSTRQPACAKNVKLQPAELRKRLRSKLAEPPKRLKTRLSEPPKRPTAELAELLRMPSARQPAYAKHRGLQPTKLPKRQLTQKPRCVGVHASQR